LKTITPKDIDVAPSKKKYRPGIDDPPPTLATWIAGIIGASSLLAVVAATSLRLRKYLRKDSA
jgi:hypothetical protein